MYLLKNLLFSWALSRQTEYGHNEQGRDYRIVNFMTPGEGDLVLGRDHNGCMYMYSENA